MLIVLIIHDVTQKEHTVLWRGKEHAPECLHIDGDESGSGAEPQTLMDHIPCVSVAKVFAYGSMVLDPVDRQH